MEEKYFILQISAIIRNFNHCVEKHREICTKEYKGNIEIVLQVFN